ncbi:hypothetical protein J7M22_04525 [Candidatus Poribacteria bacterium]|nr:hypothetical protein [Candidatus Poribacteria bacterium]
MKSLVLPLLLLSLTPAFGGIFIDDFEDGDNYGWKVISGEWKVEGGAYVQSQDLPMEARNLSGAFYTLLQSPWNIANGTIELTVRFEEGAEESDQALLLFRMVDELNGYALKLNADGLTVYKLINGSFNTIRMEPSEVKFPEDHIKVKLDGMWIWVHLNGVLRMRVGDADFERKGFKEGKVGLGVVACQHPIHFEEIKVEGENIRQFRINLPVELDGELPLTWAALKENRTEAE